LEGGIDKSTIFLGYLLFDRRKTFAWLNGLFGFFNLVSRVARPPRSFLGKHRFAEALIAIPRWGSLKAIAKSQMMH